MSNFNRSIDLIGNLPNVLQNSLEMQTIMSAETPKVMALWEACEIILDDQFILQATENGLARREEMLEITPYATDTIDDRRLRILARYNENIPYTRKTLENLLESLCGEDGYTLEIITREFTVNVEVSLNVKTQVETITSSFERILPYNMMFSVTLLYNKWEKTKDKLWAEVQGFLWLELQENALN